jgi:hypothetical protein
VQGQAIDVIGRQQYRQHAGAGHALFDQMRRLVCGNRCGFAIAATLDLAHMFDHADLHRHDLQLLADFLANGVLAATAGTGLLRCGQFVNDLDTRKIGGQRLAFARRLVGGTTSSSTVSSTLSASLNKAVCGIIGSAVFSDLRPQRGLRNNAFFFFEMDDLALIRLALTQHFLKQLLEQLLEQNRVVRKVFGHGNRTLDDRIRRRNEASKLDADVCATNENRPINS